MHTCDDAMTRLQERGVSASLRKPSSCDGSRFCELDIWLEPGDVLKADEVLHMAGFHRIRVSGHAPHRFYIAFDGQVWHKVDAKLTGRAVAPASIRRILRHGPASTRRYGPVVAVLGPDAVYRQELLARLQRAIPLGVYVARTRRASLTGERGARAVDRIQERIPRQAAGRRGGAASVALRVVRHIRLVVRVYMRSWSGTIVLWDGHPVESLFIDPERTTATTWFERTVMPRLIPWPDVVLVLEAQADAPELPMHGRLLERSTVWPRQRRRALPSRRVHVVPIEGSPERVLAQLSSAVSDVLCVTTRLRFDRPLDVWTSTVGARRHMTGLHRSRASRCRTTDASSLVHQEAQVHIDGMCRCRSYRRPVSALREGRQPRAAWPNGWPDA